MSKLRFSTFLFILVGSLFILPLSLTAEPGNEGEGNSSKKSIKKKKIKKKRERHSLDQRKNHKFRKKEKPPSDTDLSESDDATQTPSPNAISLLSLTKDPLLCLAKFLDTGTLSRARLVCTKLRDVFGIELGQRVCLQYGMQFDPSVRFAADRIETLDFSQSIKKLDFFGGTTGCDGLGWHHLARFIPFLRECKHLKKLDLSSGQFSSGWRNPHQNPFDETPYGAHYLYAGLTALPTLRELRLRDCSLYDVEFRALGLALPSLPHLRILDLSGDLPSTYQERICHGNRLTSPGMQDLCQGLQGHQQLHTLLFSARCLTPQGAQQFEALAAIPTLRDISITDIDPAPEDHLERYDPRTIIKSLRSMTQLTHLDLSYQDEKVLQVMEINQLAKLLHAVTSLDSLRLSMKIHPDWKQLNFPCVEFPPQLTDLTLNVEGAHPELYKALAYRIGQVSTLQKLFLNPSAPFFETDLCERIPPHLTTLSVFTSFFDTQTPWGTKLNLKNLTALNMSGDSTTLPQFEGLSLRLPALRSLSLNLYSFDKDPELISHNYKAFVQELKKFPPFENLQVSLSMSGKLPEECIYEVIRLLESVPAERRKLFFR